MSHREKSKDAQAAAQSALVELLESENEKIKLRAAQTLLKLQDTPDPFLDLRSLETPPRRR